MEETFCAAHLERLGHLVSALHIVDGEAMCSDCFAGKPLIIPKPRRKRTATCDGAPASHDKASGEGKVASRNFRASAGAVAR